MLTETMTNKTLRIVMYVAKDGDIDSQLLIEKITEKVK